MSTTSDVMAGIERARAQAAARGEYVQPLMPTPRDSADTVTTEPIGSGMTEIVRLDGRTIGDVCGTDDGRPYLAQPSGARHGSYRFATRDDAIAAVVSHHRRGWWTGEV